MNGHPVHEGPKASLSGTIELHVFTGPTISAADATEQLEATYHPPVSEGDIVRLLDKTGAEREQKPPIMIGIIDGYFERVPSVWHKELLYAVSRGIPVFGSASMGALRAAELAPFGMIGVGAIFEAYRDGRIEDDDEVAVIHGPAELGFPALSEAMVNIRRTLADAAADKVISEATAETAETIAKALHYKSRSYAEIFKRWEETGLPEDELSRLKSWLPSGRVDQKREDALQMLQTMGRVGARGSSETIPPFHFEHTSLWDQAVRRAKSAGRSTPTKK